ncbi:GPTC3-like protein [Mya arenaria]|uniref:GPTC3-like protein n=1 Tax=Mya arenaria TaxID=6604 RepID=A0ABY7DYR4_MYAAR|nr:GPTC3-like protein [Mya arenaria]
MIKMESTNQETTVCYAIINNIPMEYHSKDLRDYFSQFVESKGFMCFHFRHRPEAVTSTNSNSQLTDSSCEKRSTCCVVKILESRFLEFFKMYNRKHWYDAKGEIMKQACYVFRIRVPAAKEDPKLLTRGESKIVPTEREVFTENDLKTLPELNPPDIMPNGNVGTPTMVFLDFIKQCRLPPKIIKKLGLTFPKTRSSKQYGSVPFDYGGDVREGVLCDNVEVMTGSGHSLVSEKIHNCRTQADTNNGEEGNRQTSTGTTPTSKRKKKSWRDEEARRRMDLNIEEKMMREDEDPEEDQDLCEEWERHEALMDDPANQERNKERLFEEDIELKWEKGGSGLVFYTDAQYWQALEGDFDEQTTDDWDVDMSGYYEPGAGDKDARDFLAMRQEKRRREGVEQTDRFTAVHTKGVGRRILETQGWKEGQGLGSTIRGRADALDNDGQHPRDRRGIGYHGEKINRNPGRAQRKVIISTVFDDPGVTDPHEPLTRRFEPYHLKYRDEVAFHKAKEKVHLSNT